MEWKGEPITPAPEQKRKSYKVKKTFTSDLAPDDEIGLCLEHISPEIDYHEWIMVGMIIKAHGGSCSTWDQWSQSGETYKAGECDRKWETFNGSGLKIFICFIFQCIATPDHQKLRFPENIRVKITRRTQKD